MKLPRQALVSWLSIALLTALCTVLAVLQYRWTGEISRAEADRLRSNLQLGLDRVSTDFNNDITQAAIALAPPAALIEEQGREAAYTARYRRWREAGRGLELIRRTAIAIPGGEDATLLLLDTATQTYQPAAWPTEWAAMHGHIRSRLQPNGPREGPRLADNAGTLIELPRFALEDGRPREQDWLILEFDEAYLKDALVPSLIARHIGDVAGSGYEHKVLTSRDEAPPGSNWDGSISLLSIRYDMVFRNRGGMGGGPFGFGGGPRGGGGPGPGSKRMPRQNLDRPAAPPGMGGRWQLLVRYRGGSLDAFVAQTRRRNLAISGGILALMLATVVVLVRVSRQAQALAELQMNFVAGVSHELRTPLTVIRTAAFNLKGRMSSNPAAVERYGNLIQQEAERLTIIVEQVLQFASSNAGRTVRERLPIAVTQLTEDALAATRSVTDAAGCTVEVNLAPNLPMVLGDTLALQHVLQNLITNAVKYGTEGNNWIGLSATLVEQPTPMVEIRVADRGPGIPLDEQSRIFEPFFRGQRAVQDQIRGTGLGLTLVKQIIDAHGGTIHVESKPMLGSEFVVRLPLAPMELQDEFAHSTR